MNVDTLRAGDFVAYTSDRACFQGTATRYGHVLEVRNGDAICRFGRLQVRLFNDPTDPISIRRLGTDEARALFLTDTH